MQGLRSAAAVMVKVLGLGPGVGLADVDGGDVCHCCCSHNTCPHLPLPGPSLSKPEKHDLLH